MVKYKTQDGMVLTLAEVRAAYPNVSFPASLSDGDCAAFGLVPVFYAPPPAVDPLEVAVEVAPVYDEAKAIWHTGYEVRPRHADIPDGLTKAEQDAAYLAAIAPKSVAEMNKRAFRDLAVGIIGFANWQAAQADPALAEVWDIYAAGNTVARADVLAFLPGFVALGHATQAHADQLLAEWPHA